MRDPTSALQLSSDGASVCLGWELFYLKEEKKKREFQIVHLFEAFDLRLQLRQGMHAWDQWIVNRLSYDHSKHAAAEGPVCLLKLLLIPVILPKKLFFFK